MVICNRFMDLFDIAFMPGTTHFGKHFDWFYWPVFIWTCLHWMQIIFITFDRIELLEVYHKIEHNFSVLGWSVLVKRYDFLYSELFLIFMNISAWNDTIDIYIGSNSHSVRSKFHLEKFSPIFSFLQSSSFFLSFSFCKVFLFFIYLKEFFLNSSFLKISSTSSLIRANKIDKRNLALWKAIIKKTHPSSLNNRFTLNRKQHKVRDEDELHARRFSFEISLHSCTGVEKSSISSTKEGNYILYAAEEECSKGIERVSMYQ